MKKLQDVVSDYVADHNTTKDALIKKLNFGRSSFFSKVRGESEFTLGEAYRLSRELGCTLDDFYAMTEAGK